MNIAASLEAPSIETQEGERVTVARTVAEVEALRTRWEQMPVVNLDADIDYFLTVVSHRREVLRPHVVLIERPGRPDLMAVARLEELRLESRVGYRVVARPRVRCLFVVFDGVIGAETEEDRRRVLDELRRPLREREADMLHFPKLAVDDPLYDSARRAGPWPCRAHVPLPVSHWTARIPASMDEFLAGRSSRTRKHTRYYDKRLRKEHGDALTVRRFGEESELGTLCADLEAVAATTYQRQLGAGFSGDDLERELMALGMRRGWFGAWVVYISGTPVAFWQGNTYQGTFSTGCPGFDPAYSNERVGIYALMRMVEDLCADPGVTALDYGNGDADYKRSYGDDRREEADVMLFAPTLRGVRVNLVRSAVVAVSRAAARVLGDTTFGQRLKQAWRARLARG